MDIKEIASYCNRRGFVFPNSSIYGNLSGFYEYGPLGVEMKNNIKSLWWKEFIQSRDDVVGIDGAIITVPKVWEASGHLASFNDPLVECKDCHARLRADHVVEDATNIKTDGLSKEELDKIIKYQKVRCPKCGGKLSNVVLFNQMLSTNIGPVDGNTAYLRPETAQSIFVDYKSVVDSTRVSPPFGIGQIGKAFRNEISPRNFLFRLREFEQAEIEYFVLESQKDDCPYFNEISSMEINVLTESEQKKGSNKEKRMTVDSALKQKVFTTKWHAYWTAIFYKWYIDLGINSSKLRVRQHVKEELSHYSSGTVDIEYLFPFGWKEIQGIADRSNYDLSQHQKFSGKNLEFFDENTRKKEILCVAAEPSAGIDRLFLTFLFDSLVQEKDRLVLKIDPRLAPYKVAVFPLVKKPELIEKAKSLHNKLKYIVNSFYDEKGSIGRRYRRQDEIGTPFCITIDFDTLEDNTVTIRDRDSMEQSRVNIDNVVEFLLKKLNLPYCK